MKHTYKISGMTCSSCKASVEKSLNDLDNVTKVDVNLENQEATVTMDNHIELSELQKALPKKYSITEKAHKNVFASAQNSSFEVEQEKSKLQQLKPLLLIIFYIAVASILLHYKIGVGANLCLTLWACFTLFLVSLRC